jgi:NTP pyrophosphatase (non-canonical NTP hydrolase)
MPTLEECMKKIRTLVKEKGHEDTLGDFKEKLLWAFVELGEATDVFKKHGFMPYKEEHGNTGIFIEVDPKEKITEELIDAIFYILDAYGLMFRDLGVPSPDKVFMEKWKKNMGRGHRYGRAK